ncbi:class I SAM-dependent DNA methyltransferase [Paenibacillus sp. SAF-054]|uniref:class I SAM-dependent DNA methyltransferase n=1 Tax=unclassified Paenibacillus TaxID=185978 RepID=UPI003F8178A2
MKPRGSDFYDDPSIFRSYQDRRSWNENANDTIEKPIIMQLLGDVAGKRVLDLGCGEAVIGNELLAAGAAWYAGIDGSANMIEAARQRLNGTDTEIIHTSLEDWEAPTAQYDIVLSRLVLHYIEDIEAVFNKVNQALVGGGSFIFSVEHPVITSSYGLPRGEGAKKDWTVDNYFHTGARNQEWLGGRVVKYHRTLEDIYSSLLTSGFRIMSLKESKPEEGNFLNRETYLRRMRIPLFLLMKAEKPLE